jgi:Na+-driven multidrug efflux pump
MPIDGLAAPANLRILSSEERSESGGGGVAGCEPTSRRSTSSQSGDVETLGETLRQQSSFLQSLGDEVNVGEGEGEGSRDFSATINVERLPPSHFPGNGGTLFEPDPTAARQPEILQGYGNAQSIEGEIAHASDSIATLPGRKVSASRVVDPVDAVLEGGAALTNATTSSGRKVEQQQRTSCPLPSWVQRRLPAVLGDDLAEYCRLTRDTTIYLIFLCITQTVTLSYIGRHFGTLTLSQFALGLSICNFLGIAPGTGFTGVLDTFGPQSYGKQHTPHGNKTEDAVGVGGPPRELGAPAGEGERLQTVEEDFVELWYKTFAVQVVAFVVLVTFVFGLSEPILVTVFGPLLGSGAATFLLAAMPWLALVWVGSIFNRLFLAQHLSFVSVASCLAGAVSSIPICWYFVASTGATGEASTASGQEPADETANSQHEILQAVYALTAIEGVIFAFTVSFALWHPKSLLRHLFSIHPSKVLSIILAGTPEWKRGFLRTGVAATASALFEWGACEALQFLCARVGDEDTATLTVVLNIFVFYYSFPSGLAGAGGTMVGNALTEDLGGTLANSNSEWVQQSDSSQRFIGDQSLVESPTVGSPIPMLNSSSHNTPPAETDIPDVAGKAERAKQVAMFTLYASGAVLVLTTSSLILCTLWTPVLFQLYTKDPALLERLQSVAYLLVLMHVTDTVGSAMSGLYRGVGKGESAAKQTLIAIWGVGIAAAFVLGVWLGYGLVGILVGQILGAIALVGYRVYDMSRWNWSDLVRHANR